MIIVRDIQDAMTMKKKLSSLARRAWNQKKTRTQICIELLYIVEDLKAGDILTPSNLRRIRPGLGLPPKYFDKLLGKSIMRDVKKGTPMTWDLLA